MKTLLLIVGGGLATWTVLGKIYENSQNNAIASCGGPLSPAVMGEKCAALVAVNQQWAWLPKASLSL